MEPQNLHRRGTEDAEVAQRELTKAIIGGAMAVHSELGVGLLEAVYQEALAHELRLRGLSLQPQSSVPIIYKGHQLSSPLRVDLMIDNSVIVEVKSVASLAPIHTAQLLTYLRLTGMQIGLLINFNEVHLRHGIKRIVNSLRTSASSVPLR
jgi:GxxExxY protein